MEHPDSHLRPAHHRVLNRSLPSDKHNATVTHPIGGSRLEGQTDHELRLAAHHDTDYLRIAQRELVSPPIPRAPAPEDRLVT